MPLDLSNTSILPLKIYNRGNQPRQYPQRRRNLTTLGQQYP